MIHLLHGLLQAQAVPDPRERETALDWQSSGLAHHVNGPGPEPFCHGWYPANWDTGIVPVYEGAWKPMHELGCWKKVVSLTHTQ